MLMNGWMLQRLHLLGYSLCFQFTIEATQINMDSPPPYSLKCIYDTTFNRTHFRSLRVEFVRIRACTVFPSSGRLLPVIQNVFSRFQIYHLWSSKKKIYHQLWIVIYCMNLVQMLFSKTISLRFHRWYMTLVGGYGGLVVSGLLIQREKLTL